MQAIDLTDWNSGEMVNREHGGYTISATPYVHAGGEISWSVTASSQRGGEVPQRLWIQGTAIYTVETLDQNEVVLGQVATDLDRAERSAILEVISCVEP